MEYWLNKLSKSNVVYQFSWPDYESSNIGKTERTLFEKTKEHVTRVDSDIKGHLDNCSNVEHLFSIHNLILNDINTHEFRLNLVRHSTRLIDQSNNWNILSFKEAYHIRENIQFSVKVLKFLRRCNSPEWILTIMYTQIMF